LPRRPGWWRPARWRRSLSSRKVVPIGRIVDEARNRPEAKNPDGTWTPGYAAKLEHLLSSLVDDLTDNLFGSFGLDTATVTLRRRKTTGNMVFNDKGTCIGVEPDRHARLRRKNAKKAKDARQRKKEQEVMLQLEKPSKSSEESRTPAACKRGVGVPGKSSHSARTGAPLHQVAPSPEPAQQPIREFAGDSEHHPPSNFGEQPPRNISRPTGKKSSSFMRREARAPTA
jgi:hypothetical protein